MQLIRPASKGHAALLHASDLIVATGSQDNVRRATLGKPAIGVGTGNAPVIIVRRRTSTTRPAICASRPSITHLLLVEKRL